MTTVILVLIIAAFYGIATALDSRRNANRVIDEILAAEEREIERRRVAGIQSGFDAGWHGGGRR
jgi:hypothetical protein